MDLRGPTSKGGGGGKEGSREGKRREGEREGKGRGEGKGPQGLVDTPYVPNPGKYPAPNRPATQ